MHPIRSIASKGTRPAANPADRRAYPRHKPARRITCLAWTDSDSPARATVHNISARGVALIVRDWYEAGDTISVRLFNESVTFCLETKVRVIRRCTLPGGDYFIAGELDHELEPAELLPFLVG